jgi:hypothetical protein
MVAAHDASADHAYAQVAPRAGMRIGCRSFGTHVVDPNNFAT